MRKQKTTTIQLINDKNKKDPFKKKQQKTISDEGFKEKNLKGKIVKAQSEALGLLKEVRRRDKK